MGAKYNSLDELAKKKAIMKGEVKDMENLLKYDFAPKDPHADFAVVRLFNYITKLPEYQLI